MENTIRTGIIGFGLSGKVFHAPFIDVTEGFELSKVSTCNFQTIEYLHKRYPQTTVVSDMEEIIHDPNIDLVIITSPNSFHYEQTKKTLLACKNVVVEKPFTVTSDEADELIALSKKQNKLLTVYHNRRYVSDFKTVKKILNSGMLGEILDYTSHFDRFTPSPKTTRVWKEQLLPGSGTLYDLGSHLIDQALHLFGMPQAVTAKIDTQRTWCITDDHFDVKLHYPTFSATLKSSLMAKIPGPNFHIHGTKGSFLKYGLDVQEEMLGNGAIPATKDWGKEPERMWGKIDTEFNGEKLTSTIESERGDYGEFFTHLRDAIHGNKELAVKPEEARNVIRIIELAYKSNKEKRTVDVKE